MKLTNQENFTQEDLQEVTDITSSIEKLIDKKLDQCKHMRQVKERFISLREDRVDFFVFRYLSFKQKFDQANRKFLKNLFSLFINFLNAKVSSCTRLLNSRKALVILTS